VAVKSPVVAKSVQQKWAGARRQPENRVAGAHDACGFSFCNCCAKRGVVGIREIVRSDFDVEAMADWLRAAMHGKMFWGGNCFQITRIISLQSGHECHADARSEEGIFAIGFLASAPARIAKDIYVGRPERESEVARCIVVSKRVIIFGARLGGNYIRDAMN